MFDLTISEQIGPTTAVQHDIPSSRPIKFQSASEEPILSFFLQFTIEERMARFGVLPVMTSSVLGEMASIEATTSL